ncbi:hypothetical protein LRAMOSA02344 [Lichtheimia ramosa]|uniref:PIK-related kinase FAT domain-containing protein n=1 Tax=Lichtheimia ramosa TaxID=688394 RepID=A0A077WSN6_9FUNG|nr:hypothetical protein LRAMOSA02344 [Lichtheimia ramosa]
MEKVTNDKRTVLGTYRHALGLDPKWEKLYYSLARFYEKCLTETEITEMHSRQYKLCHYAVKYYLEALSMGSKYFYHVMPRVLSIWMQFAAAAASASGSQ